MKAICLHDRESLEAYLRQETFLNVYALGDLDDAFWPHTTWYGLVQDGRLQAVALMYCGLTLPTLLCFAPEQSLPAHRQLLKSLLPLLPRRFYCHLGPGLAEVLETRYALDSHGLHRKMGLPTSGQLPREEDPRIAVLKPADLLEVRALYAESYQGNWFESQMLDTNQYVGLRVDGRLVSIAGVHVYSAEYRVAALANIATRPGYRRKGYARAATGQLCHRLLRSVDHIGLNVKADNSAAVACYRSLGFETIGWYEEIMAQMK